MSVDSHGNSGEQGFVPKGMRASQGTGIGGGSRKAGFAYAIRCRFGKPRLAPDQAQRILVIPGFTIGQLHR
jgi:hypothetical protein